MRTKAALTLADAQKMLAAAKVEAEKQKWNVTIAVVDDAGRLLLLERMDGARPQTAEVATLKARSAALTHRSGKVWEDTLKQRPGMAKFPDAFPVQGGGCGMSCILLLHMTVDRFDSHCYGLCGLNV